MLWHTIVCHNDPPFLPDRSLALVSDAGGLNGISDPRPGSDYRVYRGGQESARQKLCYCERTTAVRFNRSFSLRMNNYAPQMIVKTPSLWHVLATQISAAQTPTKLFVDSDWLFVRVDLQPICIVAATLSSRDHRPASSLHAVARTGHA